MRPTGQPPGAGPANKAGIQLPFAIGAQARITLLLAVTLAAVFGILTVIQVGWNREVDYLLRERVGESAQILQRTMDLRAATARAHADDYTRWDEFVAFTKSRDSTWARVNLTNNIATFDLDAAWVLDSRCQRIFTVNLTHDPRLEAPPFPEATLTAALRARAIRHFFARTQSGLLELWSSPIQPSADLGRRTPIQGYYLIARLWAPNRVAALTDGADESYSLLPPDLPGKQPRISRTTGMVSVGEPLRGLDGVPVASLEITTTSSLFSSVQRGVHLSAIFIVAGMVCVLLGVGAALSYWIGRPLSTITEALRAQDPALLTASTNRRDELGDLARLVRAFFEQREKLVLAQEAATKGTEAKSMFLANISHELRTPMHGILSFARFGVQGAMDAPREELLDDFENIESCGSSLLSLLDDLLDLAKLEAGRMKFDYALTPIEEIVGDALDEFASYYQDKAVRVDAIAESVLEPAVVDRRKILQVLRNLLSNAGKFTPAGGAVRVRMATGGGMARITIEDSGKGIPPNELGLIFEHFTQASNARAQFGGTGLGLAISHEIITTHAGRIWAENRAAGGARFTFVIPLAGPPVVAEQDLLRSGGVLELGLPGALTNVAAPESPRAQTARPAA